MLDLTEPQLAEIRSILGEYAPAYRVFAFGSRVTGRARRYSDLDLAFVGPSPMDLLTCGELTLAFEESDLPFVVDIVDWNSASAGFRQSAGSSMVPIT